MGETDVVNLGKYDNYTSARVLWLDANGNVIAYSSSFKAGVNTNVNNLACNGSKKGAVSYMLTVALAQTAAKGPAAFETVSAKTRFVTESTPVEPVEPEPVIVLDFEEEGFGWEYGKQLSTGTSYLRKDPTTTNNKQYAVSGLIACDITKPVIVNLARYDRYTSARAVWINAEGKVIGYTSSFKAGEDVDLTKLSANGTKNGAVGFMLTVALCGNAVNGPAAYEVVTGSSVIIATGLPEAKKTVTYSVQYILIPDLVVLGGVDNLVTEEGQPVTVVAPMIDGYVFAGPSEQNLSWVDDGTVVVFFYMAPRLPA